MIDALGSSLPWHRRLGVRLGLAVALVGSLSFSAVGWLLVDHERETLTLESTRRVLVESRNLALAAGGLLLRHDPELGLHPLVLQAHREIPDLEELMVLDAQGRIVGHADLLRVGEVPTVQAGPPIEGLVVQPDERAWREAEHIVVARPIVQHGQTVGSLLARVDSERIDAAVAHSVRRAVSIIGGGLALVVGLILLLVARALRPLATLREGVTRIGSGDLTTRLGVRASNELGLLGGLLDEMAQGLQRAQEDLIQKERLDHELAIARELQKSLLPRELATPAGYVVAAHYTPAHEVSGDYYDVIPLGRDRLALVVADVSGKGVPGLVLMAMLRVMLRSLAEEGRGPASILIAANRMITGVMGRGMFITCLYGELDLRRHRFRYAGAGHCPPWVFGEGGPRALPAGGKPLGLFPPALFEASVKEREVELAPGRSLLLYTDGLVEAMDPEDRQLGEDPVLETLAAEADGKAVVEALRRAVQRHRKGRAATDDLTLLAVGRGTPSRERISS